MKTMGDRLRVLRSAKGLSQNDVAKYLGVSRSTYVCYETNKSRPVRRLPELATILGTTVAYILGTEESSSLRPTAPVLPLSDEALEIARKYDRVDKRGQGNIKSVVEREYEMTIEAQTEDVGASL